MITPKAVKVIDKKFKVDCPTCLLEREVSYFSIWDIKNGRSTGNCRKCKSDEYKEKARVRMLGNKITLGYKHSEETKKIIGSYSKRPRPDVSGDKSNFWKGGITPLMKRIRSSVRMDEWRFGIYKRDGKICTICGDKDHNGHADHIKSFAFIVADENIDSFEKAILSKKLWDIENGRFLCRECHKKTESYGRKFNLITK